MSKSVQKIELPLDSEASLDDLVVAFESCSLPCHHWTHRAHLAVAVIYVRRWSFDDALARTRDRIHAYNRNCGNSTGYNETVTRLYLMRLHYDFGHGIASEDSADELARATESYGVDWLYRYYSKARVWSAEAAEGWVSPDLNPVDFFPNSIE